MTIATGTKVEYGTGRLGQVIRAERKWECDGYVVGPLKAGPGEGTAPRWYPEDQVYVASMDDWAYMLRTNSYVKVVDVDVE